jgi:large subunit ribosomal protein L24
MANETSTKLRKNDMVQVIVGKDKGKRGKVVSIDRAKARVIVEGINIVKKAMKKRKQNDRAGIAELEAPLSVSNVMIVCNKCGPTRLGYKIEAKGKVRVCRKCGEAL